MILIDTNLLIYAHIQEYRQHPKAYAWLNTLFREEARIGLPWNSLLGFIRISALGRIHQKPIPIKVSTKIVSEWMGLPNVWMPLPGPKHFDLIKRLMEPYNGDPNLLQDAHLAALAVEHGLKVYSADKDFAKFEDINWTNPID